MLEDYFFLDSRVVLVPTEHLTTRGVDPGFAALLEERAGWSAARVDLLSSAVASYWSRCAALAARVVHLLPPRRRSIAVVRDPARVRPYVAMLNTSTWTLYETDLDPDRSHAELATYALIHGDRLAAAPEIGRVAIDLAPYWLDRSPAELRSFTDAARASTSPDGVLFREVGEALSWLRELRHETLRPPRVGVHRPIPGTGILVPRRLEARPDALVESCRERARASLAEFYAERSGAAAGAAEPLTTWLTKTAPPLLVTAVGSPGGPLWDPAAPDRIDRLEAAIARGAAEALKDILLDLQVLAAHTERFRASIVDVEALPRPDVEASQRGYTFLHRERGLLAYDLDEPGLERVRTPSLPYAREMLGARAWHEWAHLAVDAGWVPRTVDEAGWSDLERRFANALDDVVRGAPRSVRAETEPDLGSLPGPGGAGERLVRLFATRLPDYRANLLACRFMSAAERETYVRQNVRALHHEYAPAARWRLLVRFLYEAQYLSFSAVEDRRSYFLDSTGFQYDFLDSGLLDDASFDALFEAARALCEAHAVDTGRFIPGALPAPSWRTS
jgi:hypothetical protein